jgi:hypothetical protein
MVLVTSASFTSTQTLLLQKSLSRGFEIAESLKLHREIAMRGILHELSTHRCILIEGESPSI